MLRFEREEQILQLLTKEKRLRVEDLGRLLYASPSSIRRDLTSLENKGLVKRYYGGVELVQSNSAVTSFAARSHHNVGAKKIMAKKAAELVNDGDIVFLDQSSSSLYVAGELMKKKRPDCGDQQCGDHLSVGGLPAGGLRLRRCAESSEPQLHDR